MRVVYSPRAEADLIRIIDDLAALRPGSLKAMAAVIDATITRLGEHPLSGRLQGGVDVREAVTPRYGFLVFYRVRSAVEIITIQSGSQERDYRDA